MLLCEDFDLGFAWYSVWGKRPPMATGKSDNLDDYCFQDSTKFNTWCITVALERPLAHFYPRNYSLLISHSFETTPLILGVFFWDPSDGCY